MRKSVKISFFQFILLLCIVSNSAYAQHLPSFQQVRAQYHSNYAVLLDRTGKAIQTLQLDHSAQRLPWVSLQELSPAMKNALLVSEDQRFYQHRGVDWRAIASAAWENLVHNTHRGASTLTMQLAGLLDVSLTRAAGGRTYLQKWQQIKAARQLEKQWSKAQILEAYLNLVDFRADLFGIHAASEALFNKSPADINTSEASILAALLRGPNAKPAIVAERACGVAALLHTPRPACANITVLSLHQLHQHPKVEFESDIAPEAASQLLSKPGLRIVSSLDSRLQKLLISSLRNGLSPTTTGAGVILDNSTAEILAYTNTDTTINNIITVHPANALLQSFIYGLAIDQKLLTAATVLDNTPLPIFANEAYPSYMENTPDHEWVSVRTALSNTLNVAALHALALLPANDYADHLHQLGLHPANEPNTLLALANAYQALANNGLYHPASFHPAGLDQTQRIMSTKAAAIISNILANPKAKPENTTALNHYYTLSSNRQFAIGYTANFTIALWVDNTNLPTVTDIWHYIADEITRLHPSHAPKLPNNVIVQNIYFIPPIEPPRQELFLPGTEQTIFYAPLQPDFGLLNLPDYGDLILNY